MLKINRKFLSSSLALAALGLLSATNARANLVFDNISNAQNGVSGATLTATGTTPNSFMGDGYNLAPGTTEITGFDLFPYNNSGTTYTGLKLNVFIWGTVNTGTVSASAPAFSNLLDSFSVTSTGTFASGYYYDFQSTPAGSAPSITLSSPVAITGTNIGITVNVEGTTTGTTYNSANNLTSIISYGTAASVGSDEFNGYYRNANSESNGDFTSTLRSLGQSDQSVAMRIYGDATPVPEPAMWALAGLGGLALLRFGRRA